MVGRLELLLSKKLFEAYGEEKSQKSILCLSAVVQVVEYLKPLCIDRSYFVIFC